jgi:hypothetical protein
MKLLLDENIPRKLKNRLTEYEVFTVQEMGWNGKKNGDLLELMIEKGFDVFITADKNIKNQQNLSKYSIPVFILNVQLLTYDCMAPLIPLLKSQLKTKLTNGPILIKK